MMQKYDSYKDSGVQWLGEIPSHWKTVTIKNIADSSIPNSFMDGDWIESPVIIDNGIRYLTTGNIGVGIYKEQGTGHISEETFKELNCSEVYPGDILISRLNEPIGRCCIVPDLGKRIIAAVDIVIFRPNQHFYDRLFLVYQMNCYKYSNYTALEARGTTMHRISRSMLGHIKLAIPPLKEQKAISAFLTPIISQIDEAIAQQQKMIDLLNERKQIIINRAVTKGLNPNVKMKDSGVEWIGEVPEHWEIKKLKHVTSKIGSGSTPRGGAEVYQDSGVIFLRSQNIYNDGLRLDDVAHIVNGVHQKMKGTQVKYGDILYNITGGSIGRCCCYERIDEANVNQHVSIVRPNGIDSRYLMYNLQSDNGQRQLRETLKGGNREGLAAVTFKEFLILTCPNEEQKNIVSYIEKRFVNIDTAISNATKQIVLLQERKQIIINEVVTGKVKVC